MDRRSREERLGISDSFPKPPKAQADATAVKRNPLPPTDAELARAAKEGRAKNPPATITDDEVIAGQTSKK